MKDAMKYALLIAMLSVSACAGKPEPLPAGPPTNPTELQEIDRLYQGKTRIGSVTGLSCNTSASRGTYADAVGRAKIEAARLGASGIARVRQLSLRHIFSCSGRDGVRVTAVAYSDDR